jgi:hypothetical protein
MAPRLDLQALLEDITEHVYFQPPANVQMEFPCIVYARDTAVTKFAGNAPYNHTKRYQVTVIDRSPDTQIYDKIAALPMCIFNRHFVVDNLNHDVFNLYF